MTKYRESSSLFFCCCSSYSLNIYHKANQKKNRGPCSIYIKQNKTKQKEGKSRFFTKNYKKNFFTETKKLKKTLIYL